ncbi:ImcF-related family protein [Burkholderia metallica]|uniref:ImcF-related family protein n=1 Tax=Burkholderia metallica TaxID=488729 RepID=UPI0008551B68|nr:ImcF-related family protein [Burkholderia metallica]AOJ35778.1 type VI secretion protein VasK [Burkholderia metallica]
MRLNYTLAALFTALIGASLFVFGKGERIGLSTMNERLLAVCALALLFVIAIVVYALLVRRAERKAAMQAVGSAEIVDAEADGRPSAPSDPFVGLRSALRARYGFRWRYRQPWLLLTGDDPTIARLLPELAESGWLLADDAVVLWSRTSENGLPDEAWLKRVVRLRRRRPVDAVVLAVDGMVPPPAPRRGIDRDGLNLARIADTLRWAAPVYVLDVADADSAAGSGASVAGARIPRPADADAIGAALDTVRRRLADLAVAQLARNAADTWAATLSARLDTRIAQLAGWMAGLSGNDAHSAIGRFQRRQQVEGVFFVGCPNAAHDPRIARDVGEPLWRYLGDAARAVPGRRVGWHPVTAWSIVAFTALGLWTAGMLVSGVSNAREVLRTKQVLRTLDAAPDPAARLRALLALQQRIAFYESRTRERTPLMSRFGMNRDREMLAALWQPYARTSRQVLVTPVQQNLEAMLVDLGQMQTEQVDDRTSRLAFTGHEALKTYLMLAEPARADATFMTPQMVRYWSTGASLRPGEKLDLSGRLLGFYADRLKAHDDWRIRARTDLVNGARQTLLAVIGVKNSEDTIYRGVIEAAGNRYPDQTLASLTAGTDTRGLLRATVSVPGTFTRQAYDGAIAAAIEEAATRNEAAHDWVLAEHPVRHAPEQPAADLKAALTRRYFDDYADRWQGFMNGLQWEPAPTLPSSIQQLRLMADTRQSPVIALMKSLEYQAGAGALKASLSDTLVDKAQQIFGGKIDGPQMAKPDPAGPLGASFGPVLRIVAQGDDGGGNDLSLQRFMDRVTTLRLKLQQINDSPDADARAREAAQSLFQGRGSELADTHAYAQLIAASLGAQWAGMGEALFVRPVAQATQTVMQPAQASLNDAWRRTIVATWNRSFAGRYPFANTGNDASIPELARFLRPQGGLIGAFLGSQLAGVLELQGDQWVPASAGGTAVRFDPDFLKAMNLLQRMAGHLLAQGEPQYRFDLRPVPTVGVTETTLMLDGQRMHYYNQQETWQPMTWPSNRTQGLGTSLQWQTESAGANKQFEFGGRWGWIRMLERARVQPIDSATFLLTWQAVPDTRAPRAGRGPIAAAGAGAQEAGGVERDERDEGDETAVAERADSLTTQEPLVPPSPDVVYPLSVVLRTDVGKGPLELLTLRQFVLPSRIFAARGPAAGKSTARSARADGPPPLPSAFIDAAKHAGTPLPEGRRPL